MPSVASYAPRFTALRQTGWPGEPLTADNWRVAVRQRLAGVAWNQVLDDVRPFLARGADVELLTQKNVLRVVG